MVNDIIVNKIKEYRRQNYLTQVGMANILHISLATLQRYEEGKRPVPLDLAERVAELFSVSLPQLLSGSAGSELLSESAGPDQKKEKFLKAVWEAHERVYGE